MKWLAGPLVLVSLLLSWTAVAAASPKPGTFTAAKGQVQRGYDLSFKVDRTGRHITDVVAHVLENCTGSSTSSTTTVGPELTWSIKGGRFSGRKKETFDGVTAYTTLKGRFIGSSTAKGVIRQETIVAGSVCDTYELKFTARRG